jgi:hypothetical protein
MLIGGIKKGILLFAPVEPANSKSKISQLVDGRLAVMSTQGI